MSPHVGHHPGRFESIRLKPMTDLIYIAVVVAFFVAGELYVRFCEKL